MEDEEDSATPRAEFTNRIHHPNTPLPKDNPKANQVHQKSSTKSLYHIPSHSIYIYTSGRLYSLYHIIKREKGKRNYKIEKRKKERNHLSPTLFSLLFLFFYGTFCPSERCVEHTTLSSSSEEDDEKSQHHEISFTKQNKKENPEIVSITKQHPEIPLSICQVALPTPFYSILFSPSVLHQPPRPIASSMLFLLQNKIVSDPMSQFHFFFCSFFLFSFFSFFCFGFVLFCFVLLFRFVLKQMNQQPGPTTDDWSSVPATATSESSFPGLISSIAGSFILGDSLFTSSAV